MLQSPTVYGGDRMPRPPKCRRVSFLPTITEFRPAGIPTRQVKTLNLTVEELEAIRLKDLVGLDQKLCSEEMAVSRPTFARVLDRAREKIARALVEGQAISIEGGNYRLSGETGVDSGDGF